MNSSVSSASLPWIKTSVLAVGFGASVGGCSPLEIPEGPDLAPIQEEYDHPTGGLTEEEVEEIAAAAQAAYAEVQALGKLGFVVDTLDEVDGALEQFAKKNSGGKGRFKLAAVTKARTICPGHETKTSADSTNGSLELTLTIERNLLNATIWGAFDQCQLRHDVAGIETAVTADGDLGILLSGEMKLSDVDLSSILISFVGSFEVLDEFRLVSGTYTTDLNFRLIDQDEVEVSVPGSGGNVVFAFGADELEAAVRTVGGSFCCKFEQQSCAAIIGDACGDPESGDTTLTW